MNDPTLDDGSQSEILEGPSPEENGRFPKLQTRLTDFILHLIQAFLRTGYYTAEHPESKKAKEGLYEEFVLLFKQEDELTFLLREDQEQQEIQVREFPARRAKTESDDVERDG